MTLEGESSIFDLLASSWDSLDHRDQPMLPVVLSKLWIKEHDSWLAVEVLCLLGWDLMKTCLRQRLGLDEMAE